MSIQPLKQLLCLICRSEDHMRSECSIDWPGQFPDHRWAFTDHRAQFIRKYTQPAGDELCSRCKDLNILSMFEGDVNERPPHKGVATADHSESQHCRDLGEVNTVEFLSDCPLCHCLFGLAPNPRSSTDHLYLLTDWTIRRVERLVKVEPSTRGRYDKCLLIEAAPAGGEVWFTEHLGDAIGILRQIGSELPLGLQLIDPAVLSLNKMHELVDTCKRLHPRGCTPALGPDLDDIRLFDIETRSVVLYPGKPCDYLTLSYVWGGIDAPPYRMGECVGPLPRTIEDAITLTRLLGKRYLWVDFLCVSQDNEAEKLHQVQRFHAIYGGAWATIVALSSPNMDSGIARVPGSKRSSHPQLSCIVDGVRLAGLMPTLSLQMQHQKWGGRAWTLQEALLSPRSFYVSDHQVYFECNSMSCCESLDERASWVHQSPRDHHTTLEDRSGFIYGTGTLRKAHGEGKLPRGHIDINGTLLHLYTSRNMTKDTDVIMAYSGVMQYLTELIYPMGYFWGHPIQDFNWSLLWYHNPVGQRRNGNFPCWSWTGWKGGLKNVYPYDEHNSQGSYTHFVVRGVQNGSLQILYPPQSIRDNKDCTPALFPIQTVFETISDMSLLTESDIDDISKATETGQILIDCAFCDLDFVYGKVSVMVYNHLHHEIHIQGKQCSLRAMPPGTIERVEGKQDSVKNLVLVAREHLTKEAVAHHFLQIEFDDERRGRRTGRVYTLLILVAEPEALEAIEVTRRKIILV